MAYIHFLIPAEGGEAEKRLGEFLRGHAVLKIEQRFVDRPDGIFWAYAIHYDALPASVPSAMPKRELGKDRIDYQEKLSEGDFALYVKLRDWRQKRAEAADKEVYTVFKNAQLAELARNRPTTLEGVALIDGVGDGRLEQHAAAVEEMLAGHNGKS